MVRSLCNQDTYKIQGQVKNHGTGRILRKNIGILHLIFQFRLNTTPPCSKTMRKTSTVSFHADILAAGKKNIK